MAVTVRIMTASDREAWAAMRAALWPEDTAAQHHQEIDELLDAKDAWAFLARTDDDQPAGFAEVSLRKYANGCTDRPVPFLEGIWTLPELRRTGVGAVLLAEIERFFTHMGFRELCSDALATNTGSRRAHAGWGFSETETVVYFRKPFGGGGQQ